MFEMHRSAPSQLGTMVRMDQASPHLLCWTEQAGRVPSPSRDFGGERAFKRSFLEQIVISKILPRAQTLPGHVEAQCDDGHRAPKGYAVLTVEMM